MTQALFGYSGRAPSGESEFTSAARERWRKQWTAIEETLYSWLTTDALEQMRVDGYEPPSDLLVRYAVLVVQNGFNRDVAPAPVRVAADGEGGLSFEWRWEVNGRDLYAVVPIGPDGRVLMSQYVDGRRERSQELSMHS